MISYQEWRPFGASSYRAVNASIEVSPRRNRYTGQERDEETGLDLMGARYYAPWLGRWTASDPIGLGDGVNRYAYVSGNPISLRDPSGQAATKSAQIVAIEQRLLAIESLSEDAYGEQLAELFEEREQQLGRLQDALKLEADRGEHAPAPKKAPTPTARRSKRQRRAPSVGFSGSIVFGGGTGPRPATAIPGGGSFSGIGGTSGPIGGPMQLPGDMVFRAPKELDTALRDFERSSDANYEAAVAEMGPRQGSPHPINLMIDSVVRAAPSASANAFFIFASSGHVRRGATTRSLGVVDLAPVADDVVERSVRRLSGGRGDRVLTGRAQLRKNEILSVVAHGNEASVGRLSAAELAVELEGVGVSNASMLELISCKTGCGAFAQDLANVTGKRVRAATGPVVVDSSGVPRVVNEGTGQMRAAGEGWKTFDPAGG